MFFFFCHIFTAFIVDNRNREKITNESCDDREFREVVGIGASTDPYSCSQNHIVVHTKQVDLNSINALHSIALIKQRKTQICREEHVT